MKDLNIRWVEINPVYTRIFVGKNRIGACFINDNGCCAAQLYLTNKEDNSISISEDNIELIKKKAEQIIFDWFSQALAAPIDDDKNIDLSRPNSQWPVVPML